MENHDCPVADLRSFGGKERAKLICKEPLVKLVAVSRMVW